MILSYKLFGTQWWFWICYLIEADYIKLRETLGWKLFKESLFDLIDGILRIEYWDGYSIRPYWPFPYQSNPPLILPLDLPPCRYSTAKQDTMPYILFFLEWIQQRSHPGSTQRDNKLQEVPLPPHRLIERIIAAPPNIIPDSLNKSDLDYGHIRIWVRLEYIPSYKY